METEYVKCDICGLDDNELWGEKDGLSIVKCKKCSLIYTNPRPTGNELRKYYTSEYFSNGNIRWLNRYD